MGDWETAKLIFDKRPDMVRTGIFKILSTALHVAVTANETKQTLHFVKELVNMITIEELELKNNFSNTAFWLACSCGSTEMAKILMEKNPNLLNIRGNGGLLPLVASAGAGWYNLVKHLYYHSDKMNGHSWTSNDRIRLFRQCVERDFYDIALQIVKDRPELADNVSILEVLARKPDALNNVENDHLITRIIKSTFRFFHMKLQPVAEVDTDALKLLKHIWRHATRTMNLDEIEAMLRRPPRILFVAANLGNTRFIVELLRTYPDLMFNTNEDGLTIFHIAVMHRHQGIFNLLYEIGKINNDVCMLSDKNTQNNMLHLVGKTSKEMAAKTPGASLLMQRELLWFKEVDKMMRPYLREAKNRDGLTPYELFSKENEDQVSKELKWTKDCMVVTTLIVTVAFAAAFTVPGGYKGENGLPFFIHQPAFIAISSFGGYVSLNV
ncbi:hypothetical protein M8C21_028965 [Ambrosia artemisiifolia]|uniref:PGG domain-containing protein n=1 Tax=Ambrosia artemisiifolia TaxID=4212 RepID=A0AAD5CPE1_AMBAR|nr:hypothetical protein M8C21_028965 [Ambrosia artemisiifolia]